MSLSSARASLARARRFHLARAGAQVTVVDQAHDGRATAAGAGIICPWVSGADDPAFYRLYVEGARYYRELVPALAELGETDLGFRARRARWWCRSDADELAAFTRCCAGVAPTRRRWARRACCRRARPGRCSRRCAPTSRALHVANGARVDGRRMAAGLLRAAQRLGATMVEGHAELMPRRSRHRRQAARCERSRPTAWLSPPAPGHLRCCRHSALRLPIEPQRGQIVHLHLPGQDTRDWPVVLPPGSHYLLAFDDSRVVAGATRETGAGFDYRVTASGQAEVLAEALHVAPGLATATIIETRVGFRPVGPGVRPLLGRVRAGRAADRQWPGRGGLTIGPFAGRLLADAALGRAAA